MSDWVRERGLWLLTSLLVLVLTGLTLLAGLGNWNVGGQVLLALLTLACGGGLAVLVLNRAVREGRGVFALEQKNLQDAREQIVQLTRDLRSRMEQLVSERNRAEFLHQSLAELTGSLEPRRVLSGILRKAIVAAGADCGSILLLDEEGQPNEFFLSRLTGPEETSRRATAVLTEGFAGWVVSNQRGDVVFDTSQDGRWVHFEDKALPRSAVGVPFLRRGRVLGVLVLTHSLPFQFDEADLALLEQLAQQAALCLENADLFTEAESERSTLAAILQGTTEAVIVVGKEGRILLINQAAEHALQVDAGECLGRPLSRAIPHQGLLGLFLQVMESNRAACGEWSSDGHRVYSCSITPVPSVGWVAVLPDITYLKELDRLKSEFVATVSHDLRSPLTALNGYAELVAAQGSLTADQRDSLDQIRSIAWQLNDLVSDLLNLGRIEAGINMEMHACRIEGTVAETVDFYLPTALEKGIDLRIEGQAPGATVRANLAGIRQAVANLIDNAIKYTPAPGSVRVRLCRGGDEVILAVEDTGVGIALADQEQLFEKFYRVRTAAMEGIPGTGLGLAIVRSIIERHGGRIWVESAPGQGSTFAFALPLLEETPAPWRT